MHSAEHGANEAVARQGLDVLEDLDDPGMGASEQDDRALRRVEVKGLVVEQRIGRDSRGVEMENFGQRFLRMGAGNFAGAKKAGGDFAGFAGKNEADVWAGQRVARGGRDADGASLVVFRLQGIGMQVDRDRGARGGQHVGQAAGVVVMPMAQHDGVHRAEIDAQRPGVVGQHEALAGVEEDAPVARFDMETKPMFAARRAGGDGVVGQYGDAEIAHGVSCAKSIQVFQTARTSSARGLAPASTTARPCRWAAVAALS